MATQETLNLIVELPKDIINNIFSDFSVKDLLRSRSVCKSWLSLFSSPDFVKTHTMIMYNIFLRLSVPDLLRLRSVCKSWLSIISSRDFTKAQLSVSTNDPHCTSHRLLLINDEGCYGRRYKYFSICSVYSLLHECYAKRRLTFDTDDESLLAELLFEPVLDEEPAFNDIVGYVVGCCKGLFCLARTDGHVIFWNPSTRKSRRLPKLDMIYHSLTDEVFCYDELNDDYKVFAIFSCVPCQREYKVSVYSSKTDCWRLIGDFPYRTVTSGKGEFANGAIHWMSRPDTRKGNVIVSLDIITEEYQDILLPKYGEYVSSPTMGTFGENLSVLFEFIDIRIHIDFWVMKDRRAKEPWTKLFTIPYNVYGLTNSMEMRPICISVNGDFLLISDRTIVLYNPEDQTLKGLPDGWFEDLSVFSYVESLVSPHL